MTPACGDLRLALGAYALSALDPTESAVVEAHLATCAACRQELGDLAPVVALLPHPGAAPLAARIPSPVSALPSPVEGALAELRRRRHAWWRRPQAAAAAGVLLLAAGAGGGVLVASRAGSPPSFPGGAEVVAHASGNDTATGARGTALLAAETWGTEVQLSLSGLTVGESCELVAVGADGTQDVAGTWRVSYAGVAEVEGATGIAPGQLTELRVMTTAGAEVVTLRVSQG